MIRLVNNMKLKRINEIEKYLMQKQSLSIPELCEHFGVSLNTIRRDISELCKSGVASKVYGGIVLKKENEVVPYNTRSVSNLYEKMEIAKLASRFIEDGDTIYVDSGTTTVHLLENIPQGINLTIVSNSLNVYNEASKYPYLNVVSIGGLLYHKTNSFVGITAVQSLEEYHINKAFMAATGITLEAGATNNSFHEAEVKRAVIRKCKKIILMADHTKIGKAAAITFCPLESVYAFVTDREPPREYADLLATRSIRCLYYEK
jgi:DeoR family myo-inositol catabolism operon transcriptional repressor